MAQTVLELDGNLDLTACLNFVHNHACASGVANGSTKSSQIGRLSVQLALMRDTRIRQLHTDRSEGRYPVVLAGSPLSSVGLVHTGEKLNNLGASDGTPAIALNS